MPVLRFREDKATQAAARFLKLRGGRMSYLKLMKLMYLADRQALLRLGRPISFDSYVSMDNGRVLSRTLDLITSEPDPEKQSYWGEYISAPNDYCVELRSEAPADQLSPAEEAIIAEVFGQFGRMNRWDLVRHTHTLPEFRDPGSSSVPIELAEILRSGGYSDEDIEAIVGALSAEAYIERLAG